VNVWLLRVAGRNAASHNLPRPRSLSVFTMLAYCATKLHRCFRSSSVAAVSYCPAIEQREEDESGGRVGGVVRTVRRVRSSTHKDCLLSSLGGVVRRERAPLLGRWVVVVWRAVQGVEGSLKVPSSHPRPEAHLA